MKVNWKGALCGAVLTILGAVLGQASLVATGVSLVSENVHVAPSPDGSAAGLADE